MSPVIAPASNSSNSVVEFDHPLHDRPITESYGRKYSCQNGLEPASQLGSPRVWAGLG